MTTSYKNFVRKLFESDEQKEARALAKIEQARNAREAARGVALRNAALQDALESAKQDFARRCAEVDEYCQPRSEQAYASGLLSGVSLKVIGEDAGCRAAFAEKAEAIKSELRKLTVAVAEKSLADFTKNNKAVIAKLPKLERAPEPPFKKAPPAVEWSNAVAPTPPSPGVRAMLGLKPGETVPLPAWEKPDSGGIKIRDLDEDKIYG